MTGTLELDVETMRSAGLQDADISRLLRLKQRVEAGEATELTPEYKRRMFLRYLVASGRVHD